MGVPLTDSAASRAGAGDMFLSVNGARHGQISGEAHDDKHKNEVEVLGWSWGMQGKASLGGGGATGKATMRELRIIGHQLRPRLRPASRVAPVASEAARSGSSIRCAYRCVTLGWL